MCVVSGAVAFYYVPKNMKGTFYVHLTFKKHAAEFWWNEARHDTDHKHRQLDEQEGIRACLPTAISIYYLPVEELRAFYRENWENWEREQPEWFDEEFKDIIPKELVR